MTVVSRPVKARILQDGHWLPLAASLRFTPTDPWAVTLVLSDGTGTHPWTFGRDLLFDSADRHAGAGDVKVWPLTDVLGRPTWRRLILSDRVESMTVDLRSSDVDAFLSATRVVPRGTESAVMEQVLSDEALRIWLGNPSTH